MVLLNNGRENCILNQYSKLVLIRCVQQGKSLERSLKCAFQFIEIS